MDYNPEDFLFSNAPARTFPDDAWQWFLDACADIDLPVSEEKRGILEKLYSHLLYVNEFLNLTRITEPAGYLKNHVYDSLTAAKLVDAYSAPGDIVLDLGSGGGYPGLPLMTWFSDRHFVLVDSRPKKVSFLKEAVKETPCGQGEARCFRGREVGHFAPDLQGKCRLVLARAVGKIVDLLPDAKELLCSGGMFVVMKGQAYPTDERGGLAKQASRMGFRLQEEFPVVLDEDDPGRWLVPLKKI